ncbi:hypothetical protein F5B20DRAFT_580886 [Whalleya microplaca]|nr:hypothetical protein F5B20DRAFT_580886 [Whalleya microplaca]
MAQTVFNDNDLLEAKQAIMPLPSLQDEFRFFEFPHNEPRILDKVIQQFRTIYAGDIFENWETLVEILKRHAAAIQRRWSKYTHSKRRAYLQTVWRAIPRTHRPEDESRIQMANGKLTKVSPEAYLWPQLNLEDLSQPEPLLLMLWSRAKNDPSYFADSDYTPCKYAKAMGIIPSPYQELEEQKPGHNRMFRGVHSPAGYGFPLRHENKTYGQIYNCSSALLLLHVQLRIYQFLVAVCKQILQDKPGEELTGQHIPIQPHPPLAVLNSGEMTSLEAAAFQAPYRTPIDIDTERMVQMLFAKLHAAEDHLYAMREDPGYFATVLSDWKEHGLDQAPKEVGETTTTTWDLGQRLIGHCVGTALYAVEMWRELHQRTVHLKMRLEEECHSTHEELHDDLADKFKRLMKLLITLEQAHNTYLYTAFVSSRPMRPYIGVDGNPLTKLKENPFAQELYHSFQLITEPDYPLSTIYPKFLDRIDQLRKRDRSAAELVTDHVSEMVSDFSVIVECRRQIALFQPWPYSFTEELQNHFVATKDLKWDIDDWENCPKHVFMLNMDSDMTALAFPIEKFYYPAGKRRGKETVEAMRQAEANLEAFWKSYLAKVEERHCLTDYQYHLKKPLDRTRPWHESEMALPKPPKPKTDGVVALVNTFPVLSIDDRPRRLLPTPVVQKTKTRGQPTTDIERADSSNGMDDETTHEGRIKVDDRAADTFGTLFYNPNSSRNPSEVDWTDFIHAMTSIGFTAKNLQGSAWQFVPTDKLQDHVCESIHVHRPHPSPKIPYLIARAIGRRMNRKWGWSIETFERK